MAEAGSISDGTGGSSVPRAGSGLPALRALLVVAAMASVLVGCGPALRSYDGRLTMLDEDLLAVRTAARPTAPAQPVRLRYRPIPRCVYDFQHTPADRRLPPIQERQVVTMRAVMDRIAVVFTAEGQEPSTVLMDATGRVTEFNLRGRPGEERVTTENALQRVAIDRQDAKLGHLSGVRDAGQVRTISINSVTLPHYTRERPRVGDIVARVESFDGQPIFDLQYRGVGTHNGSDVAVIDIIEAGGQTRELRGFSLVDLRTTLPLLSVQVGNSRWRLEQVNCGG